MSDKIKYPKTIAWTKMRDDQIAEIVGCHPNTVLRHRKEMGKPKAPRKEGSGSKPKIDDSKIDLTKSAAWNAKKQNANAQWMGVRMRQLRERRVQDDATSDDKDFWS